MRVEAAGFENIRDDAARVNGSFLYATLEELRVLREFHGHEYRQHPKFHHNVVMHLFVYEARTDGSGRDTLKLMRLEGTVADQAISIDRLETAVGTMRQGLGLPAPGARRKRGKGVTMADGVDTIQ